MENEYSFWIVCDPAVAKLLVKEVLKQMNKDSNLISVDLMRKVAGDIVNEGNCEQMIAAYKVYYKAQSNALNLGQVAQARRAIATRLLQKENLVKCDVDCLALLRKDDEMLDVLTGDNNLFQNLVLEAFGEKDGRRLLEIVAERTTYLGLVRRR